MLRHLPVQIFRNHHKLFLGLAFAAVALLMLFAAPLSTFASQVTLVWEHDQVHCWGPRPMLPLHHR